MVAWNDVLGTVETIGCIHSREPVQINGVFLIAGHQTEKKVA
jgi:hypothetical protein